MMKKIIENSINYLYHSFKLSVLIFVFSAQYIFFGNNILLNSILFWDSFAGLLLSLFVQSMNAELDITVVDINQLYGVKVIYAILGKFISLLFVVFLSRLLYLL